MKQAFVALIAVVTMAATPTRRTLDVVNNERLAYVLMNVQVLRETSADERKAFHVRLLLVPEQGECGTTPQSCPRTDLYVAVSSIDEYPDQRVYQLPPRHAWRFVRWELLPETDAPSDYVVFTLEADDPAADPSVTWWRSTRYEFRVNYHDGSVSERRAD